MTDIHNSLDSRIEQRIADLAHKKQLMQKWSEPKSTRTKFYAVAAVAAVLAAVGIAVVFSSPGHPADEPLVWNEAQLRGCDELDCIATEIRSGNYAGALAMVDNVLADTAVPASLPAAQQEYIRAVNADRCYGAEWLRINILARDGRKAEAVRSLSAFVNQPGEYQQAARNLLERLR